MNSVFLLERFPYQGQSASLLFTHCWKLNCWIHTFSKWNSNSHFQDFNSGHRIYFLQRCPLHHNPLLWLHIKMFNHWFALTIMTLCLGETKVYSKVVIRFGICLSFHRLEECDTRAFFSWSRRRAVAQTRLACTKMPRAPSAFP